MASTLHVMHSAAAAAAAAALCLQLLVLSVALACAIVCAHACTSLPAQGSVHRFLQAVHCVLVAAAFTKGVNIGALLYYIV